MGRRFSHNLTSRESTEERNVACLKCGKISSLNFRSDRSHNERIRTGVVSGVGTVGKAFQAMENASSMFQLGIGEKPQEYSSCGKDSGRRSH